MSPSASFFVFQGQTETPPPRSKTALASGLDVRIGGGTSTVRQFLEADLIDHMHIVVVRIVLGRGERLWDGLEGLKERQCQLRRNC